MRRRVARSWCWRRRSRSRLSVLRLAAYGGGYRPLELLAGDLVLYHLYWPRVELAGYDAAAVRLLLLWHAAAAWPAAGGYTGCAGGCRRGAGAGVGAFCAQGHWAIMELGAERMLRLITEGKQDEAVALMNTETWASKLRRDRREQAMGKRIPVIESSRTIGIHHLEARGMR